VCAGVLRQLNVVRMVTYSKRRTKINVVMLCGLSQKKRLRFDARAVVRSTVRASINIRDDNFFFGKGGNDATVNPIDIPMCDYAFSDTNLISHNEEQKIIAELL